MLHILLIAFVAEDSCIYSYSWSPRVVPSSLVAYVYIFFWTRLTRVFQEGLCCILVSQIESDVGGKGSAEAIFECAPCQGEPIEKDETCRRQGVLSFDIRSDRSDHFSPLDPGPRNTH